MKRKIYDELLKWKNEGHGAMAMIIGMLALASAGAWAGEPVTVFQRNEGGYFGFRIPAIVTAANGDVLAFAEARKNSLNDSGEIDLVMKRSTDGGNTWSGMQVVTKDGANTCGNPAPVLDEQTGRIILVTTWNDGRDKESDIQFLSSIDTRRVFCQTSDDNGYTWSKPREITDETKQAEWTWYATGPCHGIQQKKGDHKGRIVIPCNHGLPPVITDSTRWSRTVSHLICSDDGGQTWFIAGSPNTGNESTVAEIKDGRLILNMRTDVADREEWTRHGKCRQTAISEDGGMSFGAYSYDNGLPEPRCQGSIANYTRRGRLTDALVFCNPSSDRRDNMWLKYSNDNGRTWKAVFQITEGPAAYSDLLVFRNGDVGILYENGAKNSYEQISFVRVSRKDIRKAALAQR